MYARIITVFVLIAFGVTAAMLIFTYPADAILWVPGLLIVATAIFVAVRIHASSRAGNRPAPVSVDIVDPNEFPNDLHTNPTYSVYLGNVFHKDGT